MKKILGIIVCSILSAVASAQQKVGDFIESTSYNDAHMSMDRVLNYYPDTQHDGYISCVNGKNRFTRALYGSYTDYRVETSDMPVFAIHNGRQNRNLRFILEIDGQPIPLDSVSYCKVSYGFFNRIYEIRDKRLGKGNGREPEIRLKVVASQTSESAGFFFTGIAFDKSFKITALISDIAGGHLHRNGDIGADKPGIFEAKGKPLKTATLDFGKTVKKGKNGNQPLCLKGAVIVSGMDTLEVKAYKPSYTLQPEPSDDEATDMKSFLAVNHAKISWKTPDPYINALASVLPPAAEGIWDGKTHTWLHGAVGWRMPLAGWRAAYVGDVLGMNARQQAHFRNYAASQVTDVEPTLPHPTQDSALNLARAEKKWGSQMYSNGYICRNPNRNNQMHHYDMNLNYMDELLRHFNYDANKAFMREMWPTIKRSLAWEKRNYDPDGDHLYDAYACIWASDALYYNGGAVTHSSAYNYFHNSMAAKIARVLGEDSKPYQDEADAIQKAMESTLWLADEGYWAEYKDKMGLQRVHKDAALWSVYTPIDCGVGTREQWNKSIDYVNQLIPHINGSVSTSDWMPYSWSINNVAPAEEYHMVLAMFEAGRKEEGFQLLKSVIMDNMFYGISPGNFGQLSYYDAARGECYRDFGDVIGIASRAIIQGLFGVVPNALEGKCYIRPGFPDDWEQATVDLPYLSYKYKKVNGKPEVYDIVSKFPQKLQIIVELPGESPTQKAKKESADTGKYKTLSAFSLLNENRNKLGLDSINFARLGKKCKIDKYYNAKVEDIFQNKYLSPRPNVTTLEIPIQGIGEWCHPKLTADIQCREPIVYTSLWDNYPDSVVIPVKGKVSYAVLQMAGSTNHMQTHIDNGLVIATYTDNTTDTLHLINPYNWCPIEQDYFVDGKAFKTVEPRPYRMDFKTRTLSRDLGKALHIEGVYGREIPGGACEFLKMPLNKDKRLKSITLRTLSNDVVIGLMNIYLASTPM